MNKFIGTALIAVAVGGYVYYKQHKTEIDKRLQEYEDRIMAVLLDFGTRGAGK